MFVEGKITCMATLVALTDMQLVRLAYIEEYYQLGLFNDRKSIIKTSFRVLNERFDRLCEIQIRL